MLHKSINKRGRIKTRITKNREDFWKNRVGPMRGGGGGGGAAAAAVMIATVKANTKDRKVRFTNCCCKCYAFIEPRQISSLARRAESGAPIDLESTLEGIFVDTNTAWCLQLDCSSEMHRD
eukprot:scaffold1404_cov166-Amphora_coffeaeformis.AAC.28